MAYTKGAPKPIGSGIKKGQKQLKTLLKEERRAMFDARISAKWEKVIDNLKPEYVADQFIGKAIQPIEHSGSLTISQVLDELENGHKTEEQGVEAEQPLQDKE